MATDDERILDAANRQRIGNALSGTAFILETTVCGVMAATHMAAENGARPMCVDVKRVEAMCLELIEHSLEFKRLAQSVSLTLTESIGQIPE